MIDQRFMDSLAQDLKMSPEQLEEEGIQLASANTGVTTDAGGFVGYRLNMPKGLNTRENMAKQSVLAADTLAGGGKGLMQGFVGLPGDLESIGRMALGYLGYNVDENTVLPTSEEIGKRLESVLGPVIPPNQTTGVPTAERERAAKGGTLGGEILSPGGQIALGAKVAKPVIGATKEIIKAGKDLPVGMSIKGVDESLDPLGFYSAASKAVDNIAQEKGTGAQFLAQIEKTPGVKKEELLWTGLDDFLKGKKSVTKAEVQQFLNANRVEVKEVTLNEGARPYRYVTANEWQGAINDAERVGNFDEAERITAAWENFELGGGADKPKFAKFTLPGGENYREIYLTLPVKKLTEEEARVVLGAKPDAKLSEADIDYASKKNQYIVPRAHSASPEADVNRLAQIRVNDRIDADGKKVLFVEEIQSDWHQAGRKKGYNTPEQRALDKQKLIELDAKRESLMAEQARLEELAKPFTDQGQDAPSDILDRWTMVSNSLNNLQRDYAPIANQLATGSGVPDAPFKTSWHELALKRAIQLASEGGYDRIAFTTGKTQAERYDLSKQVKMISAMPSENGKYNIYIEGKDGDALFRNQNGFSEYGQKTVTPQEFEELVGKDAASTIMQKADELNRGKVSKDQYKFYDSKPADLTIGGEGMKGFYDTILPKYLDKYGKKWDAKTGMTKIRLANDAEDAADSKLLKDLGMDEGGQAAASVHYMDITPKMKESVLTKGQPLFQMAPAIPAGVAAGQQEENQ